MEKFQKHPLLSSFALGSVMSLAMPPIGLFPILLLCVPAFIRLAYAATSWWKTFFIGWLFGAGYFIFGLYWVSAALFVDIQQWGWVLPLSAIVAPTVVGLYYALVPLAARFFKADPTRHALIFVIFWAIIEWLRGHLFTGFPWNMLGYTWTHILPIIQTNAFVGIYGLTLLTLLWASLPTHWHNKKLRYALLGSFLLAFACGTLRLALNPFSQNDHYTLRLVQPNISETAKWDKDQEWRNIEKLARLSAPPSTLKDSITYVIWPETAVAADLTLFPEIANYLAHNIPKDSHIILGNLRSTEDGKYYNSVSLMDDKGIVQDTYNKHHLVPFGEYIPYRDKIKIKAIAAGISGIGDFTRGTGARTLQTGTLPSFSPLICYEVIFPAEVVDTAQRPQLLVNVTNDAWYGKTAGPHQHFEIARIRAVEEGIPLARAANTGISAVIDSYGRIVKQQPLMTEGAIDAELPVTTKGTPYAFAQDIPFIFISCLLFLTALLRKKGKTETSVI